MHVAILHSHRPPQQCGRAFCSVAWAAEQIALQRVATDFAQRNGLRFGFHAFRRYAHIACVRHCHERMRDRHRICIARQTRND